MKKGEQIVKVIDVHGTRTCTLQTIAKVSKGRVYLEDSSLVYDLDGNEIDPAFAGTGITSYIVELEK